MLANVGAVPRLRRLVWLTSAVLASTLRSIGLLLCSIAILGFGTLMLLVLVVIASLTSFCIALRDTLSWLRQRFVGHRMRGGSSGSFTSQYLGRSSPDEPCEHSVSADPMILQCKSQSRSLFATAGKLFRLPPST